MYVRVDGTPFAKCPVLMYAVAHDPTASPLEPEPAGACPAWYLASVALCDLSLAVTLSAVHDAEYFTQSASVA